MLFFRRGRSASHFCPTLADPNAPKLATEITAGTELSAAVAAIAGFETTLNRINQPVQKYAQEVQVDGPQQFQDASMTLLENDGSGVDADSVARDEAYAVLEEGATGYLVLHPTKAAGFTVGDEVEVWPVKVGARNRSWAMETETARYVVQYAITGPPIKDAVIAT